MSRARCAPSAACTDSGARTAESVQAQLKTVGESLAAAQASCADLSSSTETLGAEKTQLMAQVETQIQQLSDLQKCTLCASCLTLPLTLLLLLPLPFASTAAAAAATATAACAGDPLILRRPESAAPPIIRRAEVEVARDLQARAELFALLIEKVQVRVCARVAAK